MIQRAMSCCVVGGLSRGRPNSPSSHLLVMSACMPSSNDRVLLLLQHLVDRVSGYMHVFTRYGYVRPFGCWWVARTHTRSAAGGMAGSQALSLPFSVVFGSYNAREGPTLHMVEPSGVSWVGGVWGSGCCVVCIICVLLACVSLIWCGWLSFPALRLGLHWVCHREGKAGGQN